MLTSPPVFKLLDSQGYLWLPYDLTEVIKLFGETFEQKNTLCHSFRIIVIPSKLFRELQILTSSKSFPYPKGDKNWPYMRVHFE